MNEKDVIFFKGIPVGLGKSAKQNLRPFCCICGNIYEGHGHNAQPVMEGRCCEECNQDKVVPARIRRMRQHERSKI